MAKRDFKAGMSLGTEIAESREERIQQLEAEKNETNFVKSEPMVQAVQPVKPITVNTPKKSVASEYTRKGYYFLSEENYWYLKDISFYQDVNIQDYLNQLLAADREANKDLLPHLPHMKNFA